ncbi:hypothetical protein RZS08_08600, partial [Arthrospira platensis SPKY1]|nr:hypothetical protein [Arthrospira platensis SPKY1]
MQHAFEAGQSAGLRQLAQRPGGKSVEQPAQRGIARTPCRQRRQRLRRRVAHRQTDRARRGHAGTGVVEGPAAPAPGHVEHRAVAQQLARPVGLEQGLPALDGQTLATGQGLFLHELRGARAQVHTHRLALHLRRRPDPQPAGRLGRVGGLEQAIETLGQALGAHRTQRAFIERPAQLRECGQPGGLGGRRVQRIVFQ